ncbi:hypothetical protein A2403_00760 [Candidatus Roizmanbacteria bacterium RIFOXYC1_FULL_41_16]|nr:MAG: hypothetical protein A2262_03380 [Candidatus Roizmanbacteria bacterium RIFOXYA2_FULL_41_8]OGK71521.1 MAG: hypothetical protein A2403_00760 [Candidatus Roizmanbacteria bacterium RIFOXYC1_FULL_41_16]
MLSNLRKNRGMTLGELLIVVIILSIVIFGVYSANYFNQIYKVRDTKRKESLSKLQKILEDFHNDHNRYPSQFELSYELADDVSANWDTALAGKVCGSRKTSQVMNNYFNELPCEPNSPESDYYYLLFDSAQKYAIFTRLENESDPIINEVGCQYGCSYFLDENDPGNSISNHYFNYYVSSSNFLIEPCYRDTDYWSCYPNRPILNDRCKICTDLSCQQGYATIFCKANWCLGNCGN